MKRGFTLIELLVVIAIIAILAAILFPVFARAREKARQTTCLSNHKQIALGILMYTQDYDEHLPFCVYGPWPSVQPWQHGYSYTRWWELMGAYTTSIPPYPSMRVGIFNCDSYPQNHPVNPSSYGYNADALGYLSSAAYDQRRFNGVSLGEVPRPAEIIMTGPKYCRAGDSVQASMTYEYCLPEAHNGGDNFSFVDGHAKWMKFGLDWRGTYYWIYWDWGTGGWTP